MILCQLTSCHKESNTFTATKPVVFMSVLKVLLAFSLLLPDLVSLPHNSSLYMKYSLVKEKLSEELIFMCCSFFCTAMFFTGVFLFMILGILENALIVYLREKKLKLAFFKEWTFVNKFLRKEKKETENPVADSGKH